MTGAPAPDEDLARLRFVEDWWPILICRAPLVWTPEQVESMIAGYERYLAREQPYALVSHNPRNGAVAGSRERKRIVEWADRPDVRARSAQLCAASATVVRDPWSRAAIAAVLWFWKPASPHRVASGPGEAVDFCVEHLRRREVPLPRPADELRREVLAYLDPI